MPNLRQKTWTTTTPATVEDAQYWEDHLIDSTVLAGLENAKHTHLNKTVLDDLSKDSDGDLNFEGQKIGGGGDAYGHVKVGSTTIDASGDDTIEFVAGSNVTMTANGKAITINASGGGGGTSGGDMYKSEFVLPGGTGQVLSAKEADHATGSDAVGSANTTVLEGLSDSAGNLMYNGRAIGGGGQGGSVLHVSTSSFAGENVSVSITDTVTGITETATTVFSSNGKASFNLISIGVATVSVEKDGVTYTSTCSIPCYSVYEAPPINRFTANIVVTAKCGNEVVSGAEVMINGNPSGRMTNSSGMATIAVSEKASYTIGIKKDGAVSANYSTVNVTSEAERSCIVNIARIKYTFSGSLSATVTGGAFTKNITSSSSPLYVYVPSSQTYALSGTLNGYDVSTTTSVTAYNEFESTITVFDATINVSTVTGAEVRAVSGTDVYTATSVGGVASVTVRKVGTFTISATIDGVTSENTTSVTIASDGETKTASVDFATIKLTFDGALIASVTKNTFNKAINTSTSPYTFYVPGLGTYALVGTLDGEDVSVDITVSSYTETTAEVSSGLVVSRWLTAGRVSQTFATLDDVLADEKTVRQLMTVHDSVDYMVESFDTDETLSAKLLASDNALKWIGLRDYAYDNMPSSFITSWLASNKWEYALKDYVPIMTNNTAPYGEAASSTAKSGYDAYRVFDNDDSTFWVSNETTATVQYRFVTPVCVKRIKCYVASNNQRIKIVASNDGVDFSKVIIDDFDLGGGNTEIKNSNNSEYFLYYRAIVTKLTGNTAWLHTLQFYGRALNVSVPTMTSNTTPWGEASADSYYSESYSSYKAFDGSDSSSWISSHLVSKNYTASGWLKYDFNKSVRLKMYTVINNQKFVEYKLSGSSNGTNYTQLDEANDIAAGTITTKECDSVEAYTSYKLEMTQQYTSGSSATAALPVISTLQFYGLDYSEREFETGSTMKYIYDHGVEFESIGFNNTTKEDYQLLLSVAQSGFSSPMINMTNYNLIRFVVGNKAILGLNYIGIGTNLTGGDDSTTYSSGFSRIKGDGLPYNRYHDISTINEEKSITIQNSGDPSNATTSIAEWWLE